MLITLMVESFYHVYIYQIIMFYTLNISQFCELCLNKAGRKEPSKQF